MPGVVAVSALRLVLLATLAAIFLVPSAAACGWFVQTDDGKQTGKAPLTLNLISARAGILSGGGSSYFEVQVEREDGTVVRPWEDLWGEWIPDGQYAPRATVTLDEPGDYVLRLRCISEDGSDDEASPVAVQATGGGALGGGLPSASTLPFLYAGLGAAGLIGIGLAARRTMIKRGAARRAAGTAPPSFTPAEKRPVHVPDRATYEGRPGGTLFHLGFGTGEAPSATTPEVPGEIGPGGEPLGGIGVHEGTPDVAPPPNPVPERPRETFWRKETTATRGKRLKNALSWFILGIFFAFFASVVGILLFADLDEDGGGGAGGEENWTVDELYTLDDIVSYRYVASVTQGNTSSIGTIETTVDPEVLEGRGAWLFESRYDFDLFGETVRIWRDVATGECLRQETEDLQGLVTDDGCPEGEVFPDDWDLPVPPWGLRFYGGSEEFVEVPAGTFLATEYEGGSDEGFRHLFYWFTEGVPVPLRVIGLSVEENVFKLVTMELTAFEAD